MHIHFIELVTLTPTNAVLSGVVTRRPKVLTRVVYNRRMSIRTYGKYNLLAIAPQHTSFTAAATIAHQSLSRREARAHRRGGGPSPCTHRPIVHGPSSVVRRSSSITHYPFSTTHQPSTIHRPPCILCRPSSVNHHPSSVTHDLPLILHP